MAYFSGRDGAVYLEVSGTYQKIGKATNWQLTSSQASLDTTTLEDTDRTVIYGVRSMTGSCRILYYQTSNDNADNYASTLINKLVKESTANNEPGIAADSDIVRMRFAVNDGSNTPVGRYVEVDAVHDLSCDEHGSGRDLCCRCELRCCWRTPRHHGLMAIYLGEAGHIELRRREINNVFTSTLDREDVDLQPASLQL